MKNYLHFMSQTSVIDVENGSFRRIEQELFFGYLGMFSACLMMICLFAQPVLKTVLIRWSCVGVAHV